MQFNYPKIEKLCSKIIIEHLFEKNESLFKYPLKLIWIETGLNVKVPAQSAVSVSKRRFKKAVTRNLLKRRMREAFRLNKTSLYTRLTSDNKQIALMFIYQSNEILPYPVIEKSMIYLLDKLETKVNTQLA